MSKWDKFLFGILLPIAAMVVGLILIMSTETNAGAAGFAALGIMLGALIVSPVVLLVNVFVVLLGGNTPAECFKRGMIAPGIVLIGAVIYQTGLWDALT